MAKRVPVSSLAFRLLARINYIPIRKMVGQTFLSVLVQQRQTRMSILHMLVRKDYFYESLCHGIYSQPCGHRTRRRREDATSQFASLRRRSHTALGKS